MQDMYVIRAVFSFSIAYTISVYDSESKGKRLVLVYLCADLHCMYTCSMYSLLSDI